MPDFFNRVGRKKTLVSSRYAQDVGNNIMPSQIPHGGGDLIEKCRIAAVVGGRRKSDIAYRKDIWISDHLKVMIDVQPAQAISFGRYMPG